jgi:hypothetical protein
LSVVTLTVEVFAGRVGETFQIDTGDGTVVMSLIESTRLGEALQPEGRAPFSLEFLGPLEPVLPQRTYRFEHDQLGELEIFIVPLGPRDDRMRYEAVFA